MTRPRADIVPPDTAGAFHCIQRCVRRAFLCGVDHYTGQSFEHRKHWVEDRIRRVADCFAVAIEAYAVMSNHLHLVLRIDPATAAAWSDDEVAARWVHLFPPREDSDEAVMHKRLRLLAHPERVSLLRQRLGNLSWLMRCLVEPIARRANREDGCKGRFWEGRYKCQRLCDERSLLAAMAYVDLNPIRAGMAEDLDGSVHTSVAARMAEAKCEPSFVHAPLKPVAGNLAPATRLTTADYLQILDWTGRQLMPGKRGRIAGRAPSPLAGIDHDSQRWTARVAAFGSGWYRVVGTAQDLTALAERMGLAWLKGIRLALRLA
ncbi:MAG TPA: hypothetical protein VGE64_02520 [Xanthomonadaceae bacterium]